MRPDEGFVNPESNLFGEDFANSLWVWITDPCHGHAHLNYTHLVWLHLLLTYQLMAFLAPYPCVNVGFAIDKVSGCPA